MTFLEAAIEVLRGEADGLHFGEIARRAVERNLLSHVGRDPEAAMRSCLNSAVRTARDGDAPLLVRLKPGHYGLREGADVPPPASTASAGAALAARPAAAPPAAPAARTSPPAGEASSSRAAVPSPRRAQAGGRSLRKGALPPAERAPEPEGGDDPSVEFEAPAGSGLEGVTDVAVVMANAMSRIVEERPELRSEFEAMQAEQAAATARGPELPQRHGPAFVLRDRPRPERVDRERLERERAERERDDGDDRPGRRRRRRRRRGRRVDWVAGGRADAAETATVLTERLLDQVAQVLGEGGGRSLHVRQIAETLAGKGLLGGEISEIERAVTSAVLVDLQQRGRASRFAARGDARYQLQGSRLPEPVAKAEQSLRDAVEHLRKETRVQLIQWLQGLGARALESVVRMWLQHEGYALVSTLPPSRGLGKLVVEEPEPDDDEGRTLVLVVPRRTTPEPKLWDGELERNGCAALTVFLMGELREDMAALDHRYVTADELATWMIARGVGVQPMTVQLPVLDPVWIESVGGLDT